MSEFGYYFYSHNLAAIKMVTQSYKAEAIRFYDYCLTNAKVIILFSTKCYGPEKVGLQKYTLQLLDLVRY